FCLSFPFFFLMIRSPLCSSLFPYTTLFRSSPFTASLLRPSFLGSDWELSLTAGELGGWRGAEDMVGRDLFLIRLRFSVIAVTTIARRIAAVAAVANDGSTVTREVAVMTVCITTETQRGLAVLPSFHAANEFVNPTWIVVEPKVRGIWYWM